jgi:hypothetical protein
VNPLIVIAECASAKLREQDDALFEGIRRHYSAESEHR